MGYEQGASNRRERHQRKSRDYREGVSRAPKSTNAHPRGRYSRPPDITASDISRAAEERRKQQATTTTSESNTGGTGSQIRRELEGLHVGTVLGASTIMATYPAYLYARAHGHGWDEAMNEAFQRTYNFMGALLVANPIPGTPEVRAIGAAMLAFSKPVSKLSDTELKDLGANMKRVLESPRMKQALERGLVKVLDHAARNGGNVSQADLSRIAGESFVEGVSSNKRQEKAGKDMARLITDQGGRSEPSRALWFLLGVLVASTICACAVEQNLSISLGDIVGWFL